VLFATGSRLGGYECRHQRSYLEIRYEMPFAMGVADLRLLKHKVAGVEIFEDYGLILTQASSRRGR
jgi:hypothetical protein